MPVQPYELLPSYVYLFLDRVKCRNDLMSRNEYFVFKEGWATYAEDPVLRRDVQGGENQIKWQKHELTRHTNILYIIKEDSSDQGHL